MVREAGATRRKLLDAASAVLLRDGPQALTLEAVAREAGVSKGGLLYHFASKGALLDGLVARWEAGAEAEMEALADGSPGSWVRAYVACGDLANRAPTERATEARLLAALAAEPRRLESVRERYAAWQARIEGDGVDPVQATVARLATDGLWMAQLLGLAAPEGELHEKVIARLLSLATPA